MPTPDPRPSNIDRALVDDILAGPVTVRLELTPVEAATLHHFIGVHLPPYHGAATRDSLLDIRRRLMSALQDAGVLS